MKRIKLALFDLQHYEMINVLISIFSDPNFSIVFFTSKKIANKIKETTHEDLKYEFVIYEDFSSAKSFFNSCEEYILKNRIEAIHFNTIDRDYNLVWKLIKNTNIHTTATIHNINTWLNTPFTLNKIALKNYYHRKKILSKTKAIVVTEELFISYIRDKKLYTKDILTLPYTLKSKDINHKINKHLRIAIPGAIDGNNRRNYKFALSVIEKINHLNPNLKFVFIGGVVGSEGEQVFQHINDLINKGCNIEHKFNPNSNQLFENEMSTCDVVFMPVKINFKYEGINEIYGKTKVTGVLYDMMRFQKPGIIPKEHVIPPTITTSIITYTNEEDLIEKILTLENNKELLAKYLTYAKSNSEHYSTSSIKKRFLPKYVELFD